MMFDLTGMTALVTGASGGLGSSIAKALSDQGARLAVSGSNVEKLEAFRSGLGGDHVALPCNLSDGAAVDQLVEQVTGMVRWRESVANMFDSGVHEFVEVGGKVLGAMVKRIAPDAQVTSIVTIEDVEALAKEIA